MSPILTPVKTKLRSLLGLEPVWSTDSLSFSYCDSRDTPVCRASDFGDFHQTISERFHEYFSAVFQRIADMTATFSSNFPFRRSFKNYISCPILQFRKPAPPVVVRQM